MFGGFAALFKKSNMILPQAAVFECTNVNVCRNLFRNESIFVCCVGNGNGVFLMRTLHVCGIEGPSMEK